MRCRSSISTESPSPERATSTPQPECIRKPRAARFMLQAPQFVPDKCTNPGGNHLTATVGPNIGERKCQRNVRILPPIDLNDGLRASILEGTPLLQQWPRLVVLGLWGGISFVLALKWFRWT